MKKLFGTDGVRGVANIEPMTTEIAMQIGRAIAFIVKGKSKGNKHPMSPWGTPAKGYRTRSNKPSDRLIVRRRYDK